MIGAFGLLFLCFSFHTKAQSIFESIEDLDKSSRENYPKLLKKYSKTRFRLENLVDLKTVSLHPYFLDNLFFHNKNNTLALATRDKCSLVDLLNTDLLRDGLGTVKKVIIRYEHTKKGMISSTLKKQTYLNLIGYKNCPGSRKLKAYFHPKNLTKVLPKEKMIFPTSVESCLSGHESFRQNVKAPYLCELALNKNQVFKPTIQNYLAKKCNALDTPKSYCKDLFKTDYWTTSLNGLRPIDPLQYYCKRYLNKNKVSRGELRRCRQAFSSAPNICESLGHGDFHLSPVPNCNELSKALINSNLFSKYEDCPARVGNDSLITASRIISHITKKSTEGAKHCSSQSTFPYAKFNQDFLESQFWNLSICYDDKIKKKEVCYPTLLDEIAGSELSLSKNVKKILIRLRGATDKSQDCRVIMRKDYNPGLLEYQAGCLIIKEDSNCYATDCKIAVRYDDLPFTAFKIQNNVSLDLLPFKNTEFGNAFIKQIEVNYKKKTRTIRNISQFLNMTKNHSDAIFLGIGCAEDILPRFFQSRQLNKCSFMPFIADGIIEKGGLYSLVVRTSIDGIHSPRIIPWVNIFTAVKNYQRFQPLLRWGLYAIY